MTTPAFLAMVAALPTRRGQLTGALHSFCSRIPGLRFVIERRSPVPRIIFVANRGSPFEFPGAVVRGRRVVAVPPLPPKLVTADEFLAGAAAAPVPAIDVNDGTTITLYWSGGSWAMSTQRGYDIRPVARGCGVNFETAAMECLAKSPEFSLDALDRKMCYTIGFKHPEYHPYEGKAPEAAAWFIRAMDMDAFNAGAAEPVMVDIGIPRQTRRTATPGELVALLAAEPGRYGFIVERDAARPLFLESDLMRGIRCIMYDIQAPRDIRRVQLITAYLDPSRRALVQELFPRYAEFYVAIEKKIAEGAADFDAIYAALSTVKMS